MVTEGQTAILTAARKVGASPAGMRSRNRLYEWVSTSAMLGIGSLLLLPGNSLEAGQFRHIQQLGAVENLIGVVIVAAGFARALALFMNGGWKIWGPRLRAIGSGFGIIMWAHIAGVLWYNSTLEHIASIGVATYVSLACGELASIFRAAYDAGWVRGADVYETTRPT